VARQMAWLSRIPHRVSLFYLRCLARAVATRDQWTIEAVTRPRELSLLLRLARGRMVVVEDGTATGWTAAAFALAEPGRRVITLDPQVRPERDAYLGLLDDDARSRVELVQAGSEQGPRALGDAEPPAVDVLFLDGDHSREGVLTAFEAWRETLVPGAVVGFHDYGDPDFPGVAEAVAELGLEGEVVGSLFTTTV
jgi:predicted O-methyltransferase YrrM